MAQKSVTIVKDGKKVRVRVRAGGKTHLFTPAQAKVAAIRYIKAKKKMKK